MPRTQDIKRKRGPPNRRRYCIDQVSLGDGGVGGQGLEREHRTEGEVRKRGFSWVEAQAVTGLGLDPVSTVLINSLPWPCLFP